MEQEYHFNTKIPTKELVEDKNLAYILGVIEGDGCIDWDVKNYMYRVELGVKDKDFALTFKKTLEDWSGFKVRMNFYIYEYVVTLGSKIITTFLKKYNTLNKIEKVVRKVKGEKEFLSGMYDSEGSVGNKEVTICNNNKQLLLLCKSFLKDLNIESGRIRINSRKGTPYKFSDNNKGFTNFDIYEFGITSRYNIIKFRDLVRFNIKRKQEKLINEINSYLNKKQLYFYKSLPNHKRKNWKEEYKKC